jgi:D-proline reductase (dithiol) PrdB
MARLDRMSAQEREHYLNMPCTTFDTSPWVVGPPLAQRKVALISTAGLQRRGDRPFAPGATDYRLIPADTPSTELVMSHISTNFDRTGFQQDWNVVFPLDRLRELAVAGDIGSLAQYHYSFMGATDPAAMEPRARELAHIMTTEGVDAALLIPV